MASIYEIVYSGKDNDPTVDDNAPVHGACLHWSRQRKEGENEDRQQEEQSTNIDREAVATQCPSTRREWFLTNAFHQDTRNGDHIRGHEGAYGERDYCVQRDCGSNVDEG